MAIDIINDAWESWRFVDRRRRGILQVEVPVGRIDEHTGGCGEQIATLTISTSVACAQRRIRQVIPDLGSSRIKPHFDSFEDVAIGKHGVMKYPGPWRIPDKDLRI